MIDEDLNKERLELALEAAGLDLWENDLVSGDVTHKAKKTFVELGYSEQEISTYIDDLFLLVHPDDVPVLKSAVAEHFSGITAQYRCEFRLRSKNGTWIWYANYGRIMEVGGSDRGRRFIGVTFNIDDRKRREDEIEQINRKLAEQNAQLESMNTSLQLLATTDSLTGLANRRKLMEVGTNECKRAKRFRHSLSLLIVDIDFFKQINDTWGHPIGDQVICMVADVCLNSTRKDLDVVARIGGEEFAIVLPQTDYANAYSLAEWLCKTVEAQRINVGNSDEWIASTVSIGVAALSDDAALLLQSDSALFELLMNKADKGLYKAKQSGRNCVFGAGAAAYLGQ
ncbi:sensor domain-containing diguanylate cyclase [Nitrosomonas sp. Nm166]|uniref:sensor domain-containing diguanylate cyclase n=1 Tax=Nitrosomonas sp. Nm166 TaxID=1881054 RepID=UPI0008F1910D|nr:sensor domain-containing diguanylate cyclase [Nitrosomonas sp. Nm166]SFE30528.1 diguanylate cyclase (GGDEF) domain-containing protein [Nitrosomonas sp. Nm166]